MEESNDFNYGSDTGIRDVFSVTVEQLLHLLNDLMVVESYKLLTNEAKPLVHFVVRLIPTRDTDATFEEITRRFATLGYTPLLSQTEDEYILQAVPHIIDSKTGNPWVNLVLFVLTIISVMFIGALHEEADLSASLLNIFRGWPFALTVLGILTAHELSHYFIGRRYNSPVSLPYFIPLPLSILGTMGALIVQRGPMRSRKALFDIGVAGPIGGLIVAVPLLFIGLATSEVGHPSKFMDANVLREVGLQQEGNSLLYLAAKYIIHGRILPDANGEDIWLSPPSRGGSVAFAAWAGLLITALNLFPIGQFDGGHVAYALWGRKAWKVARVFMFLMFAWGLYLSVTGNFAGTTWLVWGGVSLLMGPRHPPPLNDVTLLDSKRKVLGWIVVIIFFLILVPIPLVTVTL
ncbi:MAG: site-2 protease family protein [Anaerolineae bacterium]|nr:site-2 protease family protein [Anaerolineae bacterium]